MAIEFTPGLAGMSAEQKAQEYNTLLGQGYTDAQIKAAAESTFGAQPAADWSYLTNLAAQLAPATQTPTAPTAGALSAAQTQAAAKPTVTDKQIQDYFAGTGDSLPTMSKIQSDMATYGVTADRIQQATGKTLEQLDPTLTYYTGKQYEGNQVMNLAKQLASATDAGALKGGAFGTTGQSIGFNFDQAQKLLGPNASAVGQVFLDAAAQLIDKGVTDLNQLKTGDIMGTANIRQEYDASGNPTGRLIAFWGGDTGNEQTRVLTPEEAAKVKADTSYEGTTYQPIQTAIGKGIFDSNGRQISDSSQLNIGDTYTGPGGTIYNLTIDQIGRAHV